MTDEDLSPQDSQGSEAGDRPKPRQDWSSRITSARRRLAGILPFKWQLTLLLVAGGAIQTYQSLTASIDGDEGNYLTGAAAVARGQVPMVNFPARDPGIMYYLSIGARLFGPNIVVAHEQMVLLSVGSALMLALLLRRWIPGKDGDRASLLGAGLFLFVPYDVEFGPTVHLEPLATFLLTGMAFLMLREFEQRKSYQLVLGGLLLGAATLTRQSAAIVGLPFLFYLLWTAPAWRARLREMALWLVPAGALVGGFSLYLIERTDWVWFVQEMIVPPTSALKSASLAITLGLVPYSWFFGAAILMLPMAVGVAVARERWPNTPLPTLLVALFTVVLLTAFIGYPSVASSSVGEVGAVGAAGVIFPGYPELVALLLVLWGVALAIAWKGKQLHFPLPLPVVGCLAAWGVLFVGTDFSVRDFGVAPYLYDATAPMALLVAAWLVSLRPSGKAVTAAPAPAAEDPAPPTEPKPAPSRLRRPDPAAWILPLGLVVLLVATSALGAILIMGPDDTINEPALYAQTPTHFGFHYLSQVEQVDAWINSNVPTNATVFSLDDLYITDAGRANTPNLNIASAPYFHYRFRSNETPFPPDTFGLMPSAVQLLQLWNRTHLAMVVEGVRTSDMMARQPLVGWYLRTQFHPVRTFGAQVTGDLLTILERGPPPPSVQPVAWVANWTDVKSPDAMVYDPNSHLLFAGGSTSRDLWEVYPNQTLVNRTLVGVSGVKQLAIGDGWVWAVPELPLGPADVGQLQVLSEAGGNATVVSLPFADAADPTGDPTNGNVFVISSLEDRVSSYSPQGAWLWSSNLTCDPSQLQYLASPARLLVTCVNSPSAAILDPATGGLLSSPVLADGLTSLISVTGALVGLNASGGLSSWNSSEWYLYSQNPSATAEAPLAPIPGLEDFVALLPKGTFPSLVAFDARSLAQVGNFSTPLVPSALVFQSAGLALYQASVKPYRLALLQLPPPVNLTVVAPPHATVYLASQALVNDTFSVWPGVYYFQSSSPGYIDGEQATTVMAGETNPRADIGLGATIASVQATQLEYAAGVGVLATLAFLVLAMLVFPLPSERQPEDSAAREEPKVDPSPAPAPDSANADPTKTEPEKPEDER